MGSIRNVLLALCCLTLALVAGIWLGGHPGSLPSSVRDAFIEEDRALRAEVIESIKDNFYKPVKNRQLEDASLKGIVQSLDDPYSHYLSPNEAKQFQESVQGEFSGVGMSVEKERRGLRVLNIFDGSPAKEKGVRKGDLIIAVNGRSIAGLNSQLATARIKGKAGTRVRLEVLTPGKPRSRTLIVERKTIKVPVAEGRIERRGGRTYGVVKLQSFSSGAHGLLRQEIQKLQKSKPDGLVLDLRGNGGGLLTEAVLVSSLFIEDGKIVSVRGRSRPERTEKAQGDAIDPKLPLAVLVDGGSASASEIVTGALRDRDRAVVVGTNTFGKGLVQEVEPLSNGGVLDITVANYYLPSGKTIGRGGIKPQVKAADKQGTPRDEAVPVALEALAQRAP